PNLESITLGGVRRGRHGRLPLPGVVLASEIEELKQSLGFLGAGQSETVVEDETWDPVDAVAAGQHVLGERRFSFSLAIEPVGRALSIDPDGACDIGQDSGVADIAAL